MTPQHAAVSTTTTELSDEAGWAVEFVPNDVESLSEFVVSVTTILTDSPPPASLDAATFGGMNPDAVDTLFTQWTTGETHPAVSPTGAQLELSLFDHTVTVTFDGHLTVRPD